MTKYAQASKVSVQMRRERDRLVVVVADDGVGGADPLGGTGLSGSTMASLRSTELGGSRVRPGAGMRIRTEIP